MRCSHILGAKRRACAGTLQDLGAQHAAAHNYHAGYLHEQATEYDNLRRQATELENELKMTKQVYAGYHVLSLAHVSSQQVEGQARQLAAGSNHLLAPTNTLNTGASLTLLDAGNHIYGPQRQCALLSLLKYQRSQWPSNGVPNSWRGFPRSLMTPTMPWIRASPTGLISRTRQTKDFCSRLSRCVVCECVIQEDLQETQLSQVRVLYCENVVPFVYFLGENNRYAFLPRRYTIGTTFSQ